ncbi:glycosyltransferase family 4 protein [uncultured Coprobacter sp.]|jgi:eps10P|uniref:glycosyltransferase family 4 protein n=1 Tax=uncultured Coprobacter sp. TaxID=1720550 RepID=UPI0025D8A4DC|nr:glycosyltransferase family 4 protein [uncultured Coprobacter sp.]
MLVLKVNIGLISVDSPDDRRTSSGTLYTISENLKTIGNVRWIPLRKSAVYRFIEIAFKIIGKMCRKNICFSHTVLGAKLLSKGININDFKNIDVLIAYWCGSSFGQINTSGIPSIYISDATFPVMIDYYPPFCKLWKWNVCQGIDLEKMTMDNSSEVVLSSEWSANSAINDLKQPPRKIHVIEFGANISDKDIVKRSFKFDGILNLLFLGVEWKRKGGDIAVEATKWLNENGIPTQLHIVGIKGLDERIKNLPFVQYIGFLNKNNETEYNKLIEEIHNCHALILPTHAECSAIAFAEASAYGLPTFTFQTGGIPSYIENGRNGYMLSPDSTGEDFGRLIARCLEDGRLEKMATSAKEVYSEKLNWSVWTEKMRNLIVSLTNK